MSNLPNEISLPRSFANSLVDIAVSMMLNAGMKNTSITSNDTAFSMLEIMAKNRLKKFDAIFSVPDIYVDIDEFRFIENIFPLIDFEYDSMAAADLAAVMLE